MNNEPDLKIRESLLDNLKLNNYSKLFKDISDLQKSFPNSLFLFSLLGSMNNDLNKYKDAINNFESIIKINPNFADAYYNLGVIYKNIDKTSISLDYFEKCIKLNPKKFEAYNNIGNIHREKEETELAIKNYLKSLEINPDYLIALQNFGICLQNFEFSKYSIIAEKHIINLLSKNKILRPVDIVSNLTKFIFLNNKYNLTINNFKEKQNKISLDQLIDEFLEIKILTKLFKVTPITDLRIEKTLKVLRSKILLNISSIKNFNNAFKLMNLIASQCYINEYIYPICIEEKLELKKIDKKLKDDFEIGNFEKFILTIACLAAYKPLSDYSWSKKLLNIKEIADLVKQQIINPKYEINIRKKIKSKEIRNLISLKVKDQYENSPYPRWEKISLKNQPDLPVNIFKNLNLNIDTEIINKWDSIEILVAGCGTGQHAITTASKYKKSFITAIDLSKHSLSYAKRKAEELRIKNIDFIQMDLLNLNSYKKKFNIIEAVGVLHHMEKPYEGWNILYDNLAMGGLMMIGLYSEIARQHIKKIRNDIKKLKIKNNKEDIKNFREKIILSNNKNYRLIKESPDFYSFSNLVDLLFHVKEHRFTIPEISNYLNELNLRFCGFENRELVNFFKSNHRNYRNMYDLDLWNKFEISNPRIFAGMYQFWCQKK